MKPLRSSILPAALLALLVAAPVARADGFTVSPSAPLTGDTVTFDAGSTCGTGMVSCRWDLNGDGFANNPDESDSPRVSHVFKDVGPHVVRLIADSVPPLATQEYEMTVNAGDRPPVADILAPATAVVGVPVTFVSLARDPDDSIVAEAWDLDGDGMFDDANGSVVSRTFTTPGRKRIALGVLDAHGRVDQKQATVLVKAAPVTSLNPFPVVRVRGQVLRNGIRIQLLSVVAPRSATIGARCRPACGGSLRVTGTGRLVRLRRFERQLKPGALLELRVTAPGRIGKFVSFRVVKGSRGYIRKDACLKAGTTRPVACGR